MRIALLLLLLGASALVAPPPAILRPATVRRRAPPRATALSATATRTRTTRTAARRLNIHEEAALARLAQREPALRALRHDVCASLARTPTASEWAAAANVEASELASRLDEARRARAALVRANSGLVYAVANAYKRAVPAASLDDLAQEGVLGLVRAVDKFDPDRGLRLSTYATGWVRASMAAWLKRSGGTIRVPERVLDASTKAKRAEAAIGREVGRDATRAEVATRVGATVAAVDAARKAVDRVAVYSYDARLGAEGGGAGFTLADGVTDDEADASGAGDLRADLGAALAASLTAKELRVVRLRYGLDDGVLRSTRECAAVLGIGKESVRQICLKAFRKLRGTRLGAALLDYMD